jgi:hypothetical protein
MDPGLLCPALLEIARLMRTLACTEAVEVPCALLLLLEGGVLQRWVLHA